MNLKNCQKYKAQVLALFLLCTLSISSFSTEVRAQSQSGSQIESETASEGLSLPELQDQTFVLESKPKWEAGVGAGYIKGFDYPASTDPNNVGLVLPYVVYRSSRLRLGGGGMGAVALEEPRLRIDMALGGSLQATSEGNSARAGMPDLDFIFELGPRINYKLLTHDWPNAGTSRVSVSAKLRAAFSTDFGHVDERGVVLTTGIQFIQKNAYGPKWDYLIQFESTFATERFQDYFYQVDASQATATRAEYDAKGGYLRSNLFAGFAYRPTRSLRIFTGLVSGFYSGAANEKSPLYETSNSTGFALGMVWKLYESKKNILVNEAE